MMSKVKAAGLVCLARLRLLIAAPTRSKTAAGPIRLAPLSRPRNGQNKRNSYTAIGQGWLARCAAKCGEAETVTCKGMCSKATRISSLRLTNTTNRRNNAYGTQPLSTYCNNRNDIPNRFIASKDNRCQGFRSDVPRPIKIGKANNRWRDSPM